MGREIFESLANDELIHLDTFQKIFEKRLGKEEWRTLVNSSKKYANLQVFPKDLKQLEGQVDGATIQGIGAAFYEDRLVDEKGRVVNTNFDDYWVPLATNTPPIERIFVESMEPGFAYGCKGGGESPGIGSIVPAIANAIYDAVGVRIKTLPLTPEKVLQALAEKEGK